MKRKRMAEGIGGVELAEEAIHFLRRCPAHALSAYYLGSLPFIFGLLCFWSDMIHGARARTYVAEASLGVAALFVWMKFWHAVFAGKVHAQLAGHSPRGWSLGRLWRMIADHGFVHATGLIVLPLSFLAMLPFGYVHAFYQNFCVYGQGQGLRDSIRKSRIEAMRWPKQGFTLIWLASPYIVMLVAGLQLALIPIVQSNAADRSSDILLIWLGLFSLVLVPLCPIGLLVVINVAGGLLLFPVLLRALFGIETVVLQGGAIENSTFHAIICGVTYLILDPVVKTAHAIRCFQGESLHTGEDLRMELRAIASGRNVRGILVLGLCAAACLFAGASYAQERAVDPDQLDQRISSVLSQREYEWRMPKDLSSDTLEGGVIASFLERMAERINALWESIQRFLRWLTMSDRPDRTSGSSGDWQRSVKIAWYVFLVAILSLLAFFAVRIWMQRRTPVFEVAATPGLKLPDLGEDDLTADALPEEGWLALANEMMQRGDLRLAMRATFLAGLAALAHRELVRVAKYKSNREYERELRRRAHVRPEIPEAFSQSVSMFERVWYGMHEVTHDLMQRFTDTYNRMRALANQQ